MTVAEIASALGSASRSGAWWRCRCPVHGSRGATLALRDGDRRLIAHCHAGCNLRDVMAELRRRGLVADRTDAVARPPVPYAPDRTEAARRIALARHLWNTAQNALGSPVVRYLAGRGITMDPPPSLRWAPRCRHPSGTYLPAMVARVDSVDSELIGIHRTFLRPDGSGKADADPQKAMLGRAAGGAVCLAPAAALLIIGEGIETALAVMQATGQPAWAALSTSGMTALRLPAIIETVIVCADNDANGAGERAARTAAQRWRAEGLLVRIYISPYVGEDAADRLLAEPVAEVCDAA